MTVVFATPPYPVSSARMGGIGLRIWELAQALASEFDVTLLVPEASDLSFPGIRLVAVEEGWRDVIAEADAVIFNDLCDSRMLLAASELGKLVISENAVPLEHLEYSSVRDAPDPESAYRAILDCFRLQVLVSDHFIARSPVERATLLAALALTGRLTFATYTSPELSELVSLVPVGFNRLSALHAAAAPTAPEATDLVWNGGMWRYFDACSVARAIAYAKRCGVELSVLFMYLPLPEHGLDEGEQLLAEIKRLGIGENARLLHEPVPHPERDPYLKAASAIVCVARDGIENYTCHRLRLRDAFLYRLPVVVDRFGASADLVRTLGIGVTVDPRDPDELAEGLVAVSRDDRLRVRLLAALDRERDRFLIENNVDGLRRFLHRRRPAPDRPRTARRDAVERLLEASPHLAHGGVMPG